MSRGLLVVVLAAVLAGPVDLLAQQGPQGRREVDRQRLEQRVRAQMGLMMRDRLGLDEEEATRLSAVVQEFDERRRALFAEEQATRRSVEVLLEQGSGDQAQALELVERVSELRIQEAQLFHEEQEALLEVLTPTQLLELQDLRQELGRRIRALRGGRGGDSDRRGGPGPGPGAFHEGPREPPPAPASLPWHVEPWGPARAAL